MADSVTVGLLVRLEAKRRRELFEAPDIQEIEVIASKLPAT